jgi:hypothetical protein
VLGRTVPASNQVHEQVLASEVNTSPNPSQRGALASRMDCSLAQRVAQASNRLLCAHVCEAANNLVTQVCKLCLMYGYFNRCVPVSGESDGNPLVELRGDSGMRPSCSMAAPPRLLSIVLILEKVNACSSD